MACENIKIKMRRDPELARPGQNRLHQPGRIEDGIARFGVAEQIDQRDVIGLRPGENSHHKVEISRRKARPTIRLDHRVHIMSISSAAWQACRYPKEILPCVRTVLKLAQGAWQFTLLPLND